MKVVLDTINDGDEGAALCAKLRNIVKKLEAAFQRVRIDDAIIIGGGTKIAKHLSATATWDPANLASGAQQTQDVTVTGAALGDEATCSFSLALQGCNLWAEVQSANTVRVYQRNDTGGAINLGSGTLRASVWQH